MTLPGRIHNGVVVIDASAKLPEGTPVTVLVEQTAAMRPEERMSEEEHQRIMAIMDRIAALPLEGDAKPVSGRDHDKILYGQP